MSDQNTSLPGPAAQTKAHNSPYRIVAHFTPEAWIRDNAVEVDPEGPQEWDATAAFESLRSGYRQLLLEEMESENTDGSVIDRHDALFTDPNAPEWVRNWQGPFTIRVTRVNNPEAVHVTVIEHRHGTSMYVNRSEAGALDALYGYVETWWDTELGGDHGAITDYDKSTAIETYFEYVPDESWNVNTATIQP